MSDLREYAAALCHMKGGSLVPSEYAPITAKDDETAIKLAEAWANASMGMIGEDTWLQVLSGGKAIYSKQYGAWNS